MPKNNESQTAYERLTRLERHVVDCALRDTFGVACDLDIPLTSGESAEAAAEAIALWVLSSRGSARARPVVTAYHKLGERLVHLKWGENDKNQFQN